MSHGNRQKRQSIGGARLERRRGGDLRKDEPDHWLTPHPSSRPNNHHHRRRSTFASRQLPSRGFSLRDP
ncbi:hypothetical protein NL676_019382 [Syzygium grande]|nr:hypothetical protein NL676_019382 [Syzygium grande]